MLIYAVILMVVKFVCLQAKHCTEIIDHQIGHWLGHGSTILCRGIHRLGLEPLLLMFGSIARQR